jgi:hypothetical protein
MPAHLLRTVLCDRLGLSQQEPTFGKNEPRPSVLAIVASVSFAKAFSCFNSTVGHRGMLISKSLPIPFVVGYRSAAATGGNHHA